MRVLNVPRGACRPRCTSYDGLKASQEILRLNLRKSHVETTGMPLHRGRRYDHVRDNRLETSREAVPQMPNGLALKRALSDDKPERLSQSDAERSWNRARAQPAFLPAAVKQRCRPRSEEQTSELQSLMRLSYA